MNKIKETTLDNFNKPFARALRNLLDGIGSPLNRKVSQKELADEVGVSRQVISQYYNGLTSPNVENLKSIAEFFKVSSDFLIGLTSTPTTNIEDRMIHEKTGLADEAIKQLRDWQKVIGDNFLIKGDSPPEKSLRLISDGFDFMQQATINLLLTNKKGKLLLGFLADYIYSDYISYEKEDSTKVVLYNKKTRSNSFFDISSIKAAQLVNIQSILLSIEKEINRREEG